MLGQGKGVASLLSQVPVQGRLLGEGCQVSHRRFDLYNWEGEYYRETNKLPHKNNNNNNDKLKRKEI